jgi:carbamoyltransferase
VFVRYDWMPNFRDPARSDEDRRRDFQAHANLANLVQREVERAVLYVAQARHRLSSNENLCYAGGVALNAVANRRLLLEGPFKRLFIQPAAGDNGIAVGCAYYGWLELLKGERQAETPSVRFGRPYTSSEIETAIAECGDVITANKVDDIVRVAAEDLADGLVVGWFQGRSEFGPRALGGRSILADPRVAQVRAYINGQVKFREDFRPFAPSVLIEDMSTYYDEVLESPHMLLVSKMKSEWIEYYQSIVHLNETSRIQTVHASVDSLYHRLISTFKELTGVGFVLNTSFNKRGMPMVETPREALSFFLECGLDRLYLGSYTVEKVNSANRVKGAFTGEVPSQLMLSGAGTHGSGR